jgi:hypothetical protein
MARGRQSLIEITSPENIIETNEEVGSLPFLDIDDEYAVSGCYADMALVVRKKASKTGKEENGEDPSKVYTYYRWDELKYHSQLSGIFEIYFKVKELNNLKKMPRTKDIKDILAIEQELVEYIHKVLDINTNKQFKEVCDLTDTLLYLKEQINDAKNVLVEYKKLIKDAELEFKEAKKIIVENMPKEKKQRKVKLEEN